MSGSLFRLMLPTLGCGSLSWKGARRLRRRRRVISLPQAPRFRSGERSWGRRSSPGTQRVVTGSPFNSNRKARSGAWSQMRVRTVRCGVTFTSRSSRFRSLTSRGSPTRRWVTEAQPSSCADRSGLSTGQVELVTGGIDRDIEALIGASDGERCAVGLGVFVAPGADEESFETMGATGAMVMALPDADPYAFDDVARRVRALSDTPWEGSITDLVSTLAGSYRHETMAMQAFRFECPCTTEAVARVLISLGPEELISMALDPGHAEIVCHYCNHAYRFEEQALRLMADDLQPIEDAPLGEA